MSHAREVMHSSEHCNWATPLPMFRRLDAEFDFMWDLAAEPHNKKCAGHFGPGSELAEDGLAESWVENVGGWLFGNFPYSVKEYRLTKNPAMLIENWVEKAANEAREGAKIVGIIPQSTQTKWWQEFVRKRAFEVRHLTHRVAFDPPPGVENATSAGHNVSIVVWKPIERYGYVQPWEASVRYWSYR